MATVGQTSTTPCPPAKKTKLFLLDIMSSVPQLLFELCENTAPCYRQKFLGRCHAHSESDILAEQDDDEAPGSNMKQGGSNSKNGKI